MSNKWYTKEQIQELLNIKYVKNCTSKYISFTDEFKIKALELDRNWFYPRKIFKDLWFPEYVCNTKIPKHSLWSWRYKFKNNWLEWLVSSKKWRKKWWKTDFESMSLEEKIKYLEAENAYLKELHKMAQWHYP